MGTLKGFPNPPAVWLRRAKPASAYATSWLTSGVRAAKAEGVGLGRGQEQVAQLVTARAEPLPHHLQGAGVGLLVGAAGERQLEPGAHHAVTGPRRRRQQARHLDGVLEARLVRQDREIGRASCRER